MLIVVTKEVIFGLQVTNYLVSAPTKSKETLLMQNRSYVGGGPSSKTCPRCASHYR